MLDGAVPNSVMGMIALSKYSEHGILFYDRWLLIVHKKHDYEIFDGYTQDTVYSHISLFSSALNIIYYLNKKVNRPAPVDKIIYGLDQEYYRCLDQIRFYQKKLNGNSPDQEMFAIKLLDRQHKLVEIKTRLSKVY